MNKSVWGQNFTNLPPIQEEGKPIVWRVGWLDFIRRWHQLPLEENPFARYTGPEMETIDENRLLILNGYFDVVSDEYKEAAVNDGKYPFCEMYFTRETKNHMWDLRFAVFLDNSHGRARIECYDESLVENCRAFAEEIRVSA